MLDNREKMYLKRLKTVTYARKISRKYRDKIKGTIISGKLTDDDIDKYTLEELNSGCYKVLTKDGKKLFKALIGNICWTELSNYVSAKNVINSLTDDDILKLLNNLIISTKSGSLFKSIEV